MNAAFSKGGANFRSPVLLLLAWGQADAERWANRRHDRCAYHPMRRIPSLKTEGKTPV